MEHLRRLAPPGRVRFVDRYVSDAELPAFFRRADLLVLPHLSVDMSGVLFAGLAFGKAMVLSDVGGFREIVEDHGAGALVPPGESGGAGGGDQPPAGRSRRSAAGSRSAPPPRRPGRSRGTGSPSKPPVCTSR